MRKFSFDSLRMRLILLALLAVIPALGLSLHSGLEQRRRGLVHAQEDALRMAESASDVQDRLIENTRQIFFTLSQMPAVQQLSPEACSNIFRNLKDQSKGYTTFFATKPNGDVFASDAPLKEGINFADRLWYGRILETKKFVVSEYQIGRISGKATVGLLYPVLDRKGELKAVLGTGLDLDWLNQFMAESNLPTGSTLNVIDRNGTILLREPEKFVGKTLPEVSILKAILKKREGTSEAIGLDGVPRLYGFTSLGRFSGSVSVIVGIPKEIAFAEANQNMKRNLMWLGIVAALATMAAWVGSSLFIMRPVDRLVRITKQLGEGDLTVHAGPRYERGEIGKLALAFDRMANTLSEKEAEIRKYTAELEQKVRERTKELRESEEKYRTIFESGSHGVFLLEDVLIDCNEQACYLWACSRKEIIGKTPMDFSPPTQPNGTDSAEGVKRYISAALSGHPQQFYWRHVRKDSVLIDTEISLRALTIGSRQALLATMIDITDRKRAEESLRLASAYNRSLIEASLDPLVTIGPDGKVTDLNAATEKVTGRSRQELIGTDFMHYFSEPERAKVGYQQAFKDGFVQDYSLDIRHTDGHLTPVLYNASVYRDETGQVIGVFAAARDITERRRAEEELRKHKEHLEETVSERTLELTKANEQLQGEIIDRKCTEAALRETRNYLESLLEYANAPIIVWDPTLRMVITRFNHAFERLTGYAADEVIGKELPILFPQASRNESMSMIGRTLIGEHWESVEIPILCKNGDIRVVLWNSANICTEEGKTLLATIAQGQDITERKHAEELLRESETKYRIVAHNTYDWEFWRDPHGNFLYVSPSCKVMTGYEADEFIKDPSLLDRLIHPDDRSFFTDHRHKAEQEIESGEVEFRIIDQSGSTRWIGHVCQPILDENEVFLGTRGSNRDISDRKRAEQEIKKLNEELNNNVVQLESANRELEAFSYSVSHDLRAPLRAIDGFSRVLLEDYIDKIDNEGKRFFNIIRSNTQKMGQLIDDLLVFSRLGRQEIRVSDVDMEEMARNVFEELRLTASDQNIQFDIRHLPPARGDQAMIRQVLPNLFSNAFKFTRPREKAIIEMGGSTQQNESVYYIKDNGVGFDMQYANKLFGVFQRLHSTEEFEGTGVGLAIVQRIVHRHGGKVWAEGKVGEGACFYFTLPSVKNDRR